jgi:Zn-dependent protease
MFDPLYLLQLLATLIAVVIVLTLHEFSHAFVAYKCGDPTAKYAGRMTLNPIKHFDPMGIALFVFARFGWAKPVPVNPNNFRNRKWGSFLTSAAGIFVNYLSAFLIFYPLYMLTVRDIAPIFEGKYMMPFLQFLTGSLYGVSINFSVFNFLPLYPLDGFRMWEALDRKHFKLLYFLKVNGSRILLGLIVLNILSGYVPFLSYINVLGIVMNFLGDVIAFPIVKFWGLFF